MEVAYQSAASGASRNSADPLSVGDAISPNSGWITIADPSQVELRVLVDETDIAQVRPGLPARVTADALEGEAFEGRVTNIAPSGVLSDGVVTFDVTISVADPKGLLKGGMTTDADIVVVHRPGVLTLPRQAVTQRNGSAMVRVAQDGARFQKVQTGFMTDTHIEIVSGLSEGQTVLIPRAGQGMPVRQNAQNGQSGQNRRLGGMFIMGGPRVRR